MNQFLTTEDFYAFKLFLIIGFPIVYVLGGKFLELDLSYPSSFPLNLPQRLASKIQKGTYKDPILKQFLPTEMEEKAPLSFLEDPISLLKADRSPNLRRFVVTVPEIPFG